MTGSCGDLSHGDGADEVTYATENFRLRILHLQPLEKQTQCILRQDMEWNELNSGRKQGLIGRAILMSVCMRLLRTEFQASGAVCGSYWNLGLFVYVCQRQCVEHPSCGQL